jgi:hypothetical protein
MTPAGYAGKKYPQITQIIADYFFKKPGKNISPHN